MLAKVFFGPFRKFYAHKLIKMIMCLYSLVALFSILRLNFIVCGRRSFIIENQESSTLISFSMGNFTKKIVLYVILMLEVFLRGVTFFFERSDVKSNL